MNIVEQIHDAIVNLVQANLPSYQRLKRIFDPEQNDLRNAERGFGVRMLSASTRSGPMRHYALDQGFEIIFSRTFAERLDDDQINEVILDMYNQIDTIIVQSLYTKLSLPSVVDLVDSPAISEPQILQNRAVILRLNLNVKYRNAIP